MTTVLMVCLGNICRSPLAHGVLASMVDPKLVKVASAGTAGYHVGNPPDPRSIAVAADNGIDISQQQCRKFEKIDFLNFDHIYVMDNSNYDDIIQLAEEESHRNKVRLLLSVTDSRVTDVPDPYYGDEDGFSYVYQLVEEACTIIAKNLS